MGFYLRKGFYFFQTTFGCLFEGGLLFEYIRYTLKLSLSASKVSLDFPFVKHRASAEVNVSACANLQQQSERVQPLCVVFPHLVRVVPTYDAVYVATF